MINWTTLIKEAMQSKDKIALTAYRSVKTKEGTYLGAKKGNEITDVVQTGFIKKEIAEREESAAAYCKQYGPEYVESVKNYQVAASLTKLLPKQLGAIQTKTLVQETIKEVSASTMRDMGKVMGKLKTRTDVDMKLASSIIKELLMREN